MISSNPFFVSLKQKCNLTDESFNQAMKEVILEMNPQMPISIDSYALIAIATK